MTAQTLLREHERAGGDARGALPVQGAVADAEGVRFMRGLGIALALSLPVWSLTLYALFW